MKHDLVDVLSSGMYVYIYIYTLGVQVDHYIEIGINNSRVDYLAALMVGLTYTVYLYLDLPGV